MTAVALIVGPTDHGVVRHARLLARAAGWPTVGDVDQVPRGARVVLDVTDRLWGSTAEASGPALAAALDALHRRGARVATALHDVPFEGDGAVFGKRAAVYRSIVQRSDAVFVGSDVARTRLEAVTQDPGRVAVIPLPVAAERPAPSAHRAAAPVSVTVLGYLYPGKGHDEVLTAMAGLPSDVELVCVGRASDGHDDLVATLRSADRPVRVTGFVADPDLAPWLHAATIPVAPNRLVSASGSLATWWAHGRRPLVPDVAYTREVASVTTATFYDDLAETLRVAWTDPGSTWLPAGCRAGPTVAEVVAMRDTWLDRWDL